MTFVKLLCLSLKWLLILLALLAMATVAYVWLHPTFGGKPDEVSLAKIKASPHFNGTVFENLEPTEIQPEQAADSDDGGSFGWLGYINPPPGKLPSEPLPSVPLNLNALQDNRFAWLGHSTLLMKLNGQTLLTDPVFHRASPVFMGGAPFVMRHTYTAAQMPELDAVLISHDHYDHLDYRTIKELSAKTRRFYVPLGVKAHLQRWGVPDDKIIELDWHEQATSGDLQFTLAPARHFSGRNFTNRNSTLWGAWIIRSPELSVYFNGDSGFGRHFAENAERYGPFDLAFMENGAYNARWPQIHMIPEESVQAARILGAKQVVPIHWAKFDLAFHSWKEPIKRFLAEAEKLNQAVATPKLGEIFGLENPPQERWWEEVK